ncbi:MAG: MBL fold metallo-hydrolase [Bacilli bacterium]
MEILTFSLGMFETNCYYIRDEESGESVIIDPGMNADAALSKYLKYDKVAAILLTHAHLDHIFGLEAIRKKTGAPVYLHEAEREWLQDPALNGSARWPQLGVVKLNTPAEYLLKGGEKLSFLQTTFQVLATPGHSPGGVSYVVEEHCFAGDTLFQRSIGRTDLPGGDHKQLLKSIKGKLLMLPDDTPVYPGHGPRTTIGQEKRSNPFIE